MQDTTECIGTNKTKIIREGVSRDRINDTAT